MKGKKWWEEPVRMMREDFAPDFSAIGKLDLERVARSRKNDWKINCEWIVGTIPFDGKGYQTTFRADGYEIYPGFEHFDYLRTYTPIAHRYGIRIISYLNMHFFDYEFTRKHPDWEQILDTGEPYGKVHPLYGKGTTLCINSPWREWAFGLIREAMKTGIDGIFLDGPLVYPGCCYCPWCRKKFYAEFGQEIPFENWKDPLWKKFLKFREDSLVSFLSGARDAALQINGDAVVFLNAGSWHPSEWRTGVSMEKLAPLENFCGAEAFFHYGAAQNIYSALMTGKYLTAYGKPSIVFSHFMSGRWHYLFLPEGELKLAVSQTASSGANPWIAFVHKALETNPAAHIPVKSVFSALDRNKSILSGTGRIADIAILFSERTGKLWLSKWDEFNAPISTRAEQSLSIDTRAEEINNWHAKKALAEEFLGKSLAGYFHILVRNHFLFDIILDRDLNFEKLSKYKTVILPDAACLNQQEICAIDRYLENGGSIFASFEAGMYDEEGNFSTSFLDFCGIRNVDGMFQQFLGENYIHFEKKFLSFSKGAMIERAGHALKVLSSGNDTYGRFLKPLDRFYAPLPDVSEYPAFILHKRGKGVVAYCAEALGCFYEETGMISAEKRVTEILKYLLKKPRLITRAPKSISIELFQTIDGRICVHLANNAVDRRPVNEFLPSRDVEFTLLCDFQPKTATSLIENTRVKSRICRRTITVTVPEVHSYEIVLVS